MQPTIKLERRITMGRTKVTRGIPASSAVVFTVLLVAGIMFCTFTFWPTNLFAAVRTEMVEYKLGDTALEGYLAYDDSTKARRPGVLLIHEWMGLGPYEKRRAEQLAAMGYVAFAADIYGKGVRPRNADEAKQTSATYKNNRTLLRARVQAALDTLKKQPFADPARIAAIGYCFGGTTALELARSGADVRGVVSFHGGLDSPNPMDGRNIKAKVLVLHGADDPLVPQDQILAFQDEMRNGGVDWQMIYYGGAVHRFTAREAGDNPSTGLAYNEKADRRSWEDMKQFFGEIFR